VFVIPNKRSLLREESGRAARSVAFFAMDNRASGSLRYHRSTTGQPMNWSLLIFGW
jgi:hypothetical protein